MPAPVRFADAAADTDTRRLGPWVRMFAGAASPRLIAAALAAVVVGRALVGSWGRADLVIVAAFVAAQPFTEWLIHVFVLHFRPRTVRGRRVDLPVARKHRAHHRDPGVVERVFIPLPTLVSSTAGGALIVVLAFRSRLALSALTAALALMLAYEWTHFLIHTPYLPRSRLYRAIRRGHRLHHFRNEHYWFGITSHLGDRVSRTYPDRGAVELSATCRTLASPSTEASVSRPVRSLA